MMTEQNYNTIQAVNLALHDALGADPKLLVLGEDVADGEEGGVVGVTKGLSTAFGDEREDERSPMRGASPDRQVATRRGALRCRV